MEHKEYIEKINLINNEVKQAFGLFINYINENILKETPIDPMMFNINITMLAETSNRLYYPNIYITYINDASMSIFAEEFGNNFKRMAGDISDKFRDMRVKNIKNTQRAL